MAAAIAAGWLDDAVVAGDRVKLAKGASAVGTPSSGLAEFEMQRFQGWKHLLQTETFSSGC